MKKIIAIFFLFNCVLSSGAAENKFFQFYNSLISHYDYGDVIAIKNDTTKTICCFNAHYFITEDGPKYYNIGIVMNPGVIRVVDLSAIASIKRTTVFKVFYYEQVRCEAIRKIGQLNYGQCKRINIEIGAKYLIQEDLGKFIVTKVGKYKN